MDYQSLLTCFLILLVILLTILHYQVHGTISGKLIDKIPGMYWLPIIGNILDFMVPPEAFWHVLRRTGRDYYPIHKFWIGNWPIINIRHPDDVEVLLSSNKNIEKSLFYDFLRPWLNDGLLTSTGDKWRTRRKIITPAFHLNSLQEYCGGVMNRVEKLVDALKEESKPDGHVEKELLSLFSTYTLHSICEMAMGKVLDDKDPEQDTYRRSVYDIGEIFFFRTVRPWLKNDWFFGLTSMGREHSKALKTLHQFSNKIIKERQEYHKVTGGKYLNEFSSSPAKTSTDADDKIKRKRLAFLDLLIAVSKQGVGLDNLGIREEVDTFVFEGHDTTAVGIIFGVLLLAENKEIQTRARAEVDEILKESGGKMTMNEIQRLTYIECCIKETLRLYPSVPTISRKIVEDMQLKQYLIPKGSIVNVAIYDVHRDPNFWPRPNIYDPDRFLSSQGRHPFSYIPFSGGPRNCIGQKFAMLVLKSTIAQLLHNFYFEPLEVAANVAILPDLVIRSALPINVRFVPVNNNRK